MNKIIKKELEKAGISSTSNHIFLKQIKGIKIELFHTYIIQFNDMMWLDEFAIMYNRGIKPTHKKYKLTIEKIVGKLIKTSGFAYEDDHILNDMWDGWCSLDGIVVEREC